MYTADLVVAVQFEAGATDGLFYFPRCPGRLWLSPSQSDGYAGSLFGVNMKGCELDHSTSFRAEVRIRGAVPSLPICFYAVVLNLVQEQLHLYGSVRITTGFVWSISISGDRSQLITRFPNLNTKF
jgi:hypothetical protein